MSRYLTLFLCVVVLFAFLASCAGVVFVPDPPPAPKKEVKPPRPGPKAAWVDGHWKWLHGQYVWVAGYWVKKSKGEWVPGDWKKTPRGHKWVKGHWRR